MRIKAQAIDYRLLFWAFLLLFALYPLLASSVCGPSDLSNDFSSRWSNGRAQIKPQWTLDGSHIVFGHHGRIYAVTADGTELESLSGSNLSLHLYSETNEIDFSPTISPDGFKVAFTTLRYATGDLYEHTYEIAVQNLDGSGLRRITENSWNDSSPVWSPDGAHIAFTSQRRGLNGIYTIALDEMDEYNTTPSVKVLSDVPVWSPDGRHLAFISEGTLGVKQSIYTVEPDGSNLMRLAWSSDTEAPRQIRRNERNLALPETKIIEFRWSPDSQQIAFLANHYGELGSLYVAGYDGSEVRQILDLRAIAETKGYDAIWIQGLAWSPDSSNIYFEIVGFTYEGDELNSAYIVHTIASDGSGLGTLSEMERTEHSVESHLKWPGILLREAGRQYRDPPKTYRRLPELLEMAGPAQIFRYEWGYHYFGSDNRVPLLSIVPWDSREEKVLVMTDGRRLSLPNQANEDTDNRRRQR